MDSYKKSFSLYRDVIKGAMSRAGKSLNNESLILDFGCGAGRLLYAFRDQLDVSRIMSGCDLNERAVNWCKRLGYKSVIQNRAHELIAFPDNSFNLVVAVSVFTHLEIALQHHWAAEIARILQPGGALFMTTHGANFFPKLLQSYLNHPNANHMEFFHLGGDGLFADLRFSGGADADPQGQREVATAHTNDAVRRIFTKFDIAIHDIQTPLAGHDIYLLIKQE